MRRRINARTRRQTRPLAFSADAVGAKSGSNASGDRIPLSGNHPKLIYPLVRDLVTEDAHVRVPVAVTCQVLRFSTPGLHAVLKKPVTDWNGQVGIRLNRPGGWLAPSRVYRPRFVSI